MQVPGHQPLRYGTACPEQGKKAPGRWTKKLYRRKKEAMPSKQRAASNGGTHVAGGTSGCGFAVSQLSRAALAWLLCSSCSPLACQPTRKRRAPAAARRESAPEGRCMRGRIAAWAVWAGELGTGSLRWEMKPRPPYVPYVPHGPLLLFPSARLAPSCSP